MPESGVKVKLSINARRHSFDYPRYASNVFFCDFDLKSKETNNNIPDFDVQ
jgi:hypothetical protein